jgi:hypothetical protein
MDFRQLLLICAVSVAVSLSFIVVAGVVLFFLVLRKVRAEAMRSRIGGSGITANSARSTLARLQRVAWLMDSSIPVGLGHRIGLDGLLDILPGLGDVLGIVVSGWIIYNAASLGAPSRTLARMSANVLIDALLGSFPVLGVVADSAFKANKRNVALLDDFLQHHWSGSTQPSQAIQIEKQSL